jgi:hypothetical protein
MKTRILSLCIILGCLGGTVSFAAAQDAFPDTPANHWAYKLLADAKHLGLLSGYPDGLYRGSRPVSRYEMAVAMHAVYRNLEERIDGLSDSLKSINNVNPNDTSNLREQVSTLKSYIADLQAFGPDLDSLKEAVAAFQPELSQLGVDVQDMKHSIGDLESRVTTLEKKKPPIDIHGDLNFWLGAGNSRGNEYGLNKDGRIVGTSNPNPASVDDPFFPPVPFAAGLDRDLTTLHEAAFSFSGTAPKGPKWNGTVVVTDMFGNMSQGTTAFGNQSDVFNPSFGTSPAYGLMGYSSGIEDIYVQNLSVEMGGPKVNVEAGRVGYLISPYMLQRLDNTSYYSNPRWDNGLYYFDGAILGLNFGRAKLDVFGGRNSDLNSANGVDLNPMRSGPYDGPFTPIGGVTTSGGLPVATGTRLTVDRSIGANLQIAAGKNTHFDLAYLTLDSDTDTDLTPAQIVNRLDVYGGEGSAKLGQLDLQAGYHKSDLKANSTLVNGTDNSAWNLRLGAKTGSLNLFGEYRQIEANYLAPGDWGRLGVWRNPTNLKGFRLGASVDFTRKLTLSAHTEFDTGLSNNYSDTTDLSTQTDINAYDLRLDYRFRPNLSVYGEFEDTQFSDIAITGFSGTPEYRWTTFGLGYGIAANARFDLQYELSDINNEYQVLGGFGGTGFHGGFLTSQLTIKF